MKAKYLRSFRVFSAVSVSLLLISLLPILFVSFYNYPATDDLCYSVVTCRASGLLETLRLAADGAINSYRDWQGNFAATFLFALQPGIFGEECYWLTTPIMLVSLIGATMFFADALFVHWLHLPKSLMLTFSAIILTVQIQLLPDAGDAFFWFNGAVYYLWFYAVAMFLIALLIRVLTAKTIVGKWSTAAVSLLVAVMVGGGNYSTALIFALLLAIILPLVAIKQRRDFIYFVPVLLGFACAFCVSVIAPGNRIRGASFTSPGAWSAIVQSLRHAALMSKNWLNASFVATLLVLIPILDIAARRCKWSFRMPLVAILISFGVFACQLTPPLFAMNSVGALRQVNIYFFSFLWILAFDLFYLFGWMHRRLNLRYMAKRRGRAKRVLLLLGLWLIATVLFVTDVTLYGVSDWTSIECASAIADGSAAEFDRFHKENMEIVSTATGECELQTATRLPVVFHAQELSADSSYWVNQAYARYYGCTAVRVSERTEMLEAGGVLSTEYAVGTVNEPVDICVITDSRVEQLWMYLGEQELGHWTARNAQIEQRTEGKAWHVHCTFEYPGEYYLWYRTSQSRRSSGTYVQTTGLQPLSVRNRPIVEKWYDAGSANAPTIFHITTDMDIDYLVLFESEKPLAQWMSSDSEIIPYVSCKEWVVHYSFDTSGTKKLSFGAGKNANSELYRTPYEDYQVHE